MGKHHLKSIAAPKTWQIKRKEKVYVTRPISGGKKLEFSLPLNLIFTTFLGYCKTTKEVKTILQEKEVLIDGKREKDHHAPLSLLSVITIVPTNEYYRLTINENGKLELKKIDKEESDIKPCVIKNKTVIAKDKIQINFNDGRNLLLKKNDYHTGDALVITLPNQDIKEHIKMDEGTIIKLSAGKYIGKVGTVEKIEGDKIIFHDNDKNEHETKKGYAIPIGVKKAVITV